MASSTADETDFKEEAAGREVEPTEGAIVLIIDQFLVIARIIMSTSTIERGYNTN